MSVLVLNYIIKWVNIYYSTVIPHSYYGLIYGLYLQVIAALNLLFLPLNQDANIFLFLSYMTFTIIVHPSGSIITVNLIQCHQPGVIICQ